MADETYDKLADIFNRIGFGSRKSPELIALLKSLFDEMEAHVALHLSPFAPEPPGIIAGRLGQDPDRIAGILDTMADKGLIYSSRRDGENWYKIIQLVPGIFELQFMKGEYTGRAKELARLFDAYAHARGPGENTGGNKAPVTASSEDRSSGDSVHFARVIPIEKTISPEMNIFPFEVARKYVEKAETITVSTCYCRHEQRLLDRGCEFPDDVCLQFGSFARFVKERGFGREISRKEALDVLRKSADAGLIHTSSNTQERIDFICNCCTCCCGVLRGVSHLNAPVRTVSSNYEITADLESCVGCGECADRCQMGAIALNDNQVSLTLERCIGCGVCVYHCPSEALALIARSDFVEPPRNFRELIERQFGSGR